jgi:hypothetical protein
MTPFHITLTPMRREGRLTLARDGDQLLVNGTAFDLSAIPQGAILPRHAVACAYLASDIAHRTDGLHLTLILPHGAEAPEALRFPAPLSVIEEGEITLPGEDTPQEDAA